MKVTVHIHGGLLRYTGGVAQMDLDLPEGATVADAMARVGVPSEEVFTTVVNRKIVPEDTVLQDGDRLDLVPPIPGG
ncbi:MAG: MoaD/ThiS family protein [Anaerolineae bacterium]|nr:MoaD/ThiS family protein [Anaerolineae bacterium]